MKLIFPPNREPTRAFIGIFTLDCENVPRRNLWDIIADGTLIFLRNDALRGNRTTFFSVRVSRETTPFLLLSIRLLFTVKGVEDIETAALEA